MIATDDIHLVQFMTRGLSLRHWEMNGSIQRETELFRTLRPHLRKLTLVTYGDRSELAYRNLLPDTQILCNALRLPHRYYVTMLRHLHPALGRSGKVVFRSNQIEGADVALACAKGRKAKFICRCGYSPLLLSRTQDGLHSSRGLRLAALEERVFSQADKVVVTTNELANHVISEYGVSRETVEIVPNFVRGEFFKQPLPDFEAKGAVVFVGRLRTQKNLPTLIDAIAGIRASLDIVGDGEERGLLEDLARSYNAQIRFLGQVRHEKLGELLRHASVFVLPSHWEGHPKALIEAMASGLPVIGCRVPGVANLIQDGVTGLLCSPDSRSLGEAIHRLLNDSELRRKLGTQARNWSMANFDLTSVVQKELRLYASLFDQGS